MANIGITFEESYMSLEIFPHLWEIWQNMNIFQESVYFQFAILDQERSVKTDYKKINILYKLELGVNSVEIETSKVSFNR